jgi:hypothetical protein
MGWRFRRSLRILPGLRVNISKRGFSSLSIGRRGLTLNMGRRGVRETIGLPGTGISYTTPVQHLNVPTRNISSHPPPTSIEHAGADGPTVGWPAILVAVAFVVGVVYVIEVLK